MSSVLGETDYQTTGFSNLNIIFNQASDARYCAGCNGSFRLTFTSTSVGTASGVYGAGFDIEHNSATDYFAFITYGDNTTDNINLPANASFFGVTSDVAVKSIHIGLTNGGSTTGGSISIDDLTIGSAVPAPGALALLAAAGFASRRRRR
jgi:MYXO-CTERM domain-containing protein